MYKLIRGHWDSQRIVCFFLSSYYRRTILMLKFHAKKQCFAIMTGFLLLLGIFVNSEMNVDFTSKKQIDDLNMNHFKENEDSLDFANEQKAQENGLNLAIQTSGIIT